MHTKNIRKNVSWDCCRLLSVAVMTWCQGHSNLRTPANGPGSVTMKSTVLRCTAMYYTALYYTALYYTALYYTALPYTALHHTSLDSTELNCITFITVLFTAHTAMSVTLLNTSFSSIYMHVCPFSSWAMIQLIPIDLCSIKDRWVRRRDCNQETDHPTWWHQFAQIGWFQNYNYLFFTYNWIVFWLFWPILHEHNSHCSTFIMWNTSFLYHIACLFSWVEMIRNGCDQEVEIVPSPPRMSEKQSDMMTLSGHQVIGSLSN